MGKPGALLLLLFLSLGGRATLVSATESPAPPVARIAIIIDDLGYNLDAGYRAAHLPAAITLSVLPHSPNGAAVAEIGHQQGKEIMLHAPMSNVSRLPLDPGGLREDMLHDVFTDTLAAGLGSIPHVVGVNNHMGSYLTQLEQPMRWLMQELSRNQLYFIDSRTSADSIARQVATRFDVPSRSRDVFLDNRRELPYIARQFQQLLQIARWRGQAIAIGHPYPETLDFLSEALPGLSDEGIEVQFVSQLLNHHAPGRIATSVVQSQLASGEKIVQQ